MSLTRDEAYLRRAQYRTPANLDARASLHARYSVNPESWFHWAFTQVDPARHGRILDAGCGDGRLWSRNLGRLPAGPRVVLCDLSIGMVREAARAVRRSGADFRPVQATVQALPFPAGRFDAVVANHMLYHVPDLDRALSELCRVLVPGGRIFASTNGPRGLREIDTLLREIRPSADPNPHVAAFGLHNARTALERHFESVETRVHPNRLEVTDPEPVVAYVASLEAAADLSAGERDRLRERVSRVIERAGSFRITIEVGILAGRRPAVGA